MQHPVLQSIFAVFLIGGAGVLLSGCDTTQAQGQPAPAPIPEVGVVEIQPQTVTLSTELAGRT
ncbi:MAG: efflux transporter periplasmic adaptor subunit, partial [Candidatus Competibacteraceae bacterium]|nr:efflux transporter periplasmic adaptor subunit [Candidatus Competibacteraceae bacterium]